MSARSWVRANRGFFIIASVTGLVFTGAGIAFSVQEDREHQAQVETMVAMDRAQKQALQAVSEAMTTCYRQTVQTAGNFPEITPGRGAEARMNLITAQIGWIGENGHLVKLSNCVTAATGGGHCGYTDGTGVVGAGDEGWNPFDEGGCSTADYSGLVYWSEVVD